MISCLRLYRLHNEETLWQSGPAVVFPVPSMNGIFTYIELIFMVHVGKYTIPYMDTMGSNIELTMDVTLFFTFSLSKTADGKGMNMYSKQNQVFVFTFVLRGCTFAIRVLVLL